MVVILRDFSSGHAGCRLLETPFSETIFHLFDPFSHTTNGFELLPEMPD